MSGVQGAGREVGAHATRRRHTVNGILLLYRHPVIANAPTVLEHVAAFERYSRFPTWSVNTEFGFPRSLKRTEFKVIVLHYSMFGSGQYCLNKTFLNFLERSSHSFKVAFFQDEYQYCQQRFRFINLFGIDAVYTLLAPEYFQPIYGEHTSAGVIRSTLTGYVGEELEVAVQRWSRPMTERTIDIGYRARPLPYFMGRGEQEKYHIGVEFRQRAAGLDLRLDIDAREESRLYGAAWYRFLGDLKGILGVEAGVSIFDIDDTVRTGCERLLDEHPDMSFEEMSTRLLDAHEDNIPYRTVSPRHFEAAAFKVCQILFEGQYQGIMQPMVHYIPLKKDFFEFR